MALEIRKASLASRIASVFKATSSRETSSMSDVSCVCILQMLYVILSHRYANENNNKMYLDSTKIGARASFHKLAWLKDPHSGNDYMTNPYL